MAVTVRDALPSEYAAVGRLTVEAYAEYESVIGPEFWGRYRVDLADAAGRARDATILVAEVAGELAGGLALYRTGSSYDPWPPGWVGIRVLAVSRSHRRKGVARALMDECIGRARAAGAPALGLHTVGFMAAAVTLYESMGFVRIPRYDWHGEHSGMIVPSYGLELVPGGLGDAAGEPVTPDAERRS
jgi:GNAT superfamily N-acetyltransferase